MSDLMAERPFLAVDAASVSGWSEGCLHQSPVSGFLRFAPSGSSVSIIETAAFRWLDEQIERQNSRKRPYRQIVVEAPVTPSHLRGRTQVRTTEILFGLVSALRMASTFHGIPFRIEKVDKVRQFLLGSNRIRGDQAKKLVRDRVRQFGWIDPVAEVDLNQTDSLGLWALVHEQMAPGSIRKLLARAKPLPFELGA